MKKEKRSNFIFGFFKKKLAQRKINKKKPKTNPIYKKFEVIKTIEGDYNDFNDTLKTQDSTIGIILGARGKGKSALGLRLLENLSLTEKNLLAMGFKLGTLPKWITQIENFEEIKNNSIVLIDESGITLSSRDSMSNINKLISKIILISRHKNLSIIFITQNSANIEVNTLRQADYLLFKQSSLLQKDFERKKIKEIYSDIESYFEEHKDKKGLTYIYSDQFRGFVTNKLPGFWSESVSKSYE